MEGVIVGLLGGILAAMVGGFTLLWREVANIKYRLGRMDGEMDNIERRLGKVEGDIDDIKRRIERILNEQKGGLKNEGYALGNQG